MNFIELTEIGGEKVLFNVNLIHRVIVRSGKVGIYVNTGYVTVEESYETVLRKIDARIAGVNRS